ncbi:MAG: BatD family protein [Myxococcales bacterium]|nr:BatD family protein [Myxococcales bacterium]
MRTLTILSRVGLLALTVACLLAVSARPALAQGEPEPEVALRLAGNGAYVGMPFVLVASVTGFDDKNAPPQPPLSLPGATVKPTGVATSGAQSVSITINGRRTIRQETILSYTYEITASKAGALTIPPMTFAAGGKRARSQPARLVVERIPTSRSMQLRSQVPARTVYVGEAIAIDYEWSITENIDPTRFEVPLLGMTDTLAVSAPKVDNAEVKLPITSGANELVVGATSERAGRGQTYKFTLLVTPLKAGTIALPPAFVLGRSAFGSFGFGESELSRADDEAQTLTVKELPLTGRPASFHGAVGSAFAFGVRASRSVVALGEPMELEVTIKSDTRLDTTTLGSLVGPDALPPTMFASEPGAPVGELAPDGKTKTFRVPVQVIGPAIEIPAIAFAYFDPATASYKTIKSEPIALAVRGTELVGAAQVTRTAAAGNDGGKTAQGGSIVANLTALVGVDLALSGDAEARRPVDAWRQWFWPLLVVLYVVPVLIFFAGWWLMRSRSARQASSVRATHRRELLARLAAAVALPARDAAPGLAAALRTYAQHGGADALRPEVLQRLEVEAFAPSSAQHPLAPTLLSEIRTMIETMDRATLASGPRLAATGLAFVLGAAALAPVGAWAGAPAGDGRAAYQAALQAPQGTARQAAFARAEAQLAAAAARSPSAPAYTDWGNAALGAGQIGRAVLAYRRALHLDRSYARALRNLQWVRRHVGGEAQSATTATQTLFFFHSWSREARLLASGLWFAMLVLVLTPGVGRRLRAARPLAAAVAAVAWVALAGSLLLERGGGDEVVIVVPTSLHAADGENSPLVLPAPLAAGSEAKVLEDRGTWQKIELSQGAVGWVGAASAERIAPAPR